jgi:hypothetical protein
MTKTLEQQLLDNAKQRGNTLSQISIKAYQGKNAIFEANVRMGMTDIEYKGYGGSTREDSIVGFPLVVVIDLTQHGDKISQLMTAFEDGVVLSYITFKILNVIDDVRHTYSEKKIENVKIMSLLCEDDFVVMKLRYDRISDATNDGKGTYKSIIPLDFYSDYDDKNNRADASLRQQILRVQTESLETFENDNQIKDRWVMFEKNGEEIVLSKNISYINIESESSLSGGHNASLSRIVLTLGRDEERYPHVKGLLKTGDKFNISVYKMKDKTNKLSEILGEEMQVKAILDKNMSLLTLIMTGKKITSKFQASQTPGSFISCLKNSEPIAAKK